MPDSMASPDDQGATFVELFFDLVFVFAVTQVTHHAAHHLSVDGLLGSLVVFWLIWWAWTQYTWALNAANTDLHRVRIGTLVATAIAFVMAASVDHAFGDQAFWFALPYVLVRIVGLGLYHRVAAGDAAQQKGVRLFACASVLGLAAVIAGALAPASVRTWVWLGAALLDVYAAAVASRHREWNLHVEHFAERHGLIVIIALGESLIVAGSAVAPAERAAPLIVAGGLSLLAVCLLWWTYFGWVKDALEHRLTQVSADAVTPLARDAYTLLHFPLVCGVVSFAIGVGEILQDPSAAVPVHVGGALAVGIVLFAGSSAAALYRAGRTVLWPRLFILAAVAVALVSCAPTSAAFALGVTCAGLFAITVVEHYGPASKPA